jgi:hypothetical protein
VDGKVFTHSFLLLYVTWCNDLRKAADGVWLRDRCHDSPSRLDLEAVILSKITRAPKSQIHV